MRSYVPCVEPRGLAWLPLALVLPATSALAAVRFDSSASTAGAGSASLNVTVGVGANRYLVVAVAQLGGDGPPGARFGGQSMSPIGSAESSGCRIDVYGQAGPASGAGTITTTVSGTTPLVLAAASYDGIHQTLPTDDTSAQVTGNTATAQAGLYGANLGLGFAAMCASGQMITAMPRTGVTSRWNRATGALLGAGVDGTGGTATWQLGASGAIKWAVATFPLRAAAGGASSPPDPAVPVDAAPDAAASYARADAPLAVDTDAPLAADARVPDLATPPDAALPDGRVVVLPRSSSEDEPDAAPRTINLVVSTGCRTAGAVPYGPGALALAAVALLVVVARRRTR